MSALGTSAGMDGIAIVGMSGRFPGAPNLDAFWDKLARGIETISNTRALPTGRFSGDGGAGPSLESPASGPRPPTISSRARRPSVAGVSASRAISSGRTTCSRTASAMSQSIPGAGRGFHASGGTGSGAPGSVSIRIEARSTPETPSIMQWWVLEIMANRLRARSSTTQYSQSGFDRSRGRAKRRAASVASSAIPPGRGSAVRRRCRSRSNPSWSTHTGRPTPKGSVESRCA